MHGREQGLLRLRRRIRCLLRSPDGSCYRARMPPSRLRRAGHVRVGDAPWQNGDEAPVVSTGLAVIGDGKYTCQLRGAVALRSKPGSLPDGTTSQARAFNAGE